MQALRANMQPCLATIRFFLSKFLLMKRATFLFAAACAFCCQAALAQTTPSQAPDKSSPNLQSSSSTNTGTQTSSPTTTGMDNGSVTPPAQTRRRMQEDMNQNTMQGSATRKGSKMKRSSSGMKTKTTM
jgi:hypothetical protein